MATTALRERKKKEIKKVTKFKVSKRVFLMLQFATAAVIFFAR